MLVLREGRGREIGERALGHTWAGGRFPRRLTAGTGQPLEVVYPGWPNMAEGPDFRGARLRWGEGAALLVGDVEVERSTSGWYAHGHHRDAAFAGVILVVVGEDDRDDPVALYGGGEAPVLTLGAFLTEPADAVEACRGASRRQGEAGRAWRLEEAGVARFREKATRLAAGGLYGEEAAQALYRGLLEALGYSRNTAPFGELAERLPLGELEGLVRGRGTGEALACLWALLLGEAGLLERGRRLFAPGEARELGERWAGSRGGPGMGAGAWRTFRIRPDNLPERRLVALGVLLGRYRGEGLLWGLMSLVERAAAGPQGAAALERGLRARGPGGAVIGPGRAIALAANVVLPFALAWAGEGSALGQGALGLYRRLPCREDSGQVRALAKRLGLALTLEVQQQGLLHLLRRHCTVGGCGACPLAP